ncbi:MAG: methyltransferase domain-containing protein [Patescibacteria group bacterium]
MASPQPAQPNPPSQYHYFFILGREIALSAAEIAVCLNDQIDPNTPPTLCGQALVISGSGAIQLDHLMNRLGGTIKVGRIILKTTIKQLTATLAKGIFDTGLLVLSDKVTFGISVYGETKGFNSQAVVRLGMEVKKELRMAGYAGRFANHNEPTLSSVSVTKNNLVENGGEIVLIIRGQNVLVGRTEAVQDFEAYGRRDYGRPGRDMLQGMLPPKLAQIMINLTRAPSIATLLDPFCGSGTVLQEAYLLGIKNLIGFDTSSKAIQATTKNIHWLQEQSPKDSVGIRIEMHDATQLSEYVAPNTIDVIVTEPYLGPTRLSHNRAALEKVRVELTGLFTRTLEQFQKVLRAGGRIALVVPCWFQNQTVTRLPLNEPMRRLGFELLPFPAWAGKNPLLYHRPGQRVGREIYVMTLHK